MARTKNVKKRSKRRLTDVIDWVEEARVHKHVLRRYRATADERMERLAEAVKLMPKDEVDIQALRRLLGTPGFRNALKLPPGIHHVGGDGFDDKKPISKARVNAVAKMCIQALKERR